MLQRSEVNSFFLVNLSPSLRCTATTIPLLGLGWFAKSQGSGFTKENGNIILLSNSSTSFSNIFRKKNTYCNYISSIISQAISLFFCFFVVVSLHSCLAIWLQLPMEAELGRSRCLQSGGHGCFVDPVGCWDANFRC